MQHKDTSVATVGQLQNDLEAPADSRVAALAGEYAALSALLDERLGHVAERLGPGWMDGSAPETSITGASNRKPPATVVSGGWDTIELSIYGAWRDWETFETFAQAADVAQQEALTLEGGGWIDGPDGERIRVLEHGKSHGIYCAWKLQWEGADIHVVRRQHYSEHTLNVWVRLGSPLLLEVGEAAWQRVADLLRRMGFDLADVVVSRADPCIDLPDVSVAEFVDATTGGQCIRRGRKLGLYYEGQSPTGLAIGQGGDVSARIYDKARECTDPIKRQLMIERRWGKDCEVATRVEFQCRGKALREWGIRTWDDLMAKKAALVEHLATDWLRYASEPIKRESGNQRRTKMWGTWQRVVDAFIAWTGYIVDELEERPKRSCDRQALTRQVRGCVETIIAWGGTIPSTVEELRDLVGEVIGEALEGAKSLARVWDKRAAIEAELVGVSLIPTPDDGIPF